MIPTVPLVGFKKSYELAEDFGDVATIDFIDDKEVFIFDVVLRLFAEIVKCTAF